MIKLDRKMIAVILSLAWPTMLEQLMQTAVQYVDTAMVGALGTQATAAVGATSTVNWLVGSTVSAFGVGFLAFIARAHGANDRKGASQAAAQSVLVTLVVGLLLTALTVSSSGLVPVWMQVDSGIVKLAGKYFMILYLPMLPRAATIIFGTVLRAAGDTRTPMKIGFAVNLINVVLNFMMIYPTRQMEIFGITMIMPGAGMGVIGAAVASAVAFTVGGISITVALWKHPLVSPRGMSLKPDKSILIPCMKTAVPNMFQRFGTSLGYVAFASMINSLGDVATAAHTIANTVESAFYIPGYGMQTAAATLAGNAYGAGDNQRMKSLVSMFIPIEVGLMVISGALLFFAAPPLMGLFSDSPEVIGLGTTVLRMVAVSEPFYGFSIIMEGMIFGVGNTKKPLFYNVLGMWGVRIVGTFICTQLLHLGLVAAWGCMIAHNILIFVLYFITFLRKDWNPLEKAPV
jgi:putative MATE family efflux protein